VARGTVRAVAADYLTRHVQKNTRASTYRETKRIFDVDVLPAMGDRPIGDIARRDIGELLDRIAGRGAEVQANRTLARLKTFFGWCVDEEILAVSPIVRMKPATKERARDRALSDDEIRWFWEGCDALAWPFGPLFRLLLLTAQRRDEVGGISFQELAEDRSLWTIPRERAKNDRAHEVTLSELAKEILEGAIAGRPATDAINNSPLLFTTNGATAVSGFSRAKERLDAEMAKLAGKPVPDWTLHDLRRTAATGMARLNIPPHIVDKVLNHVSGTIRGVAAVYNRHGYVDERKAALEAWGRYVSALMREGGSNIVSMRVSA
jgi:integrase